MPLCLLHTHTVDVAVDSNYSECFFKFLVSLGSIYFHYRYLPDISPGCIVHDDKPEAKLLEIEIR